MIIDKKRLLQALVHLVESQQQAEYDFCGEQREWHLPRLNNAVILLAQVFPDEMAKAMDEAKNP